MACLATSNDSSDGGVVPRSGERCEYRRGRGCKGKKAFIVRNGKCRSDTSTWWCLIQNRISGAALLIATCAA